MAITPRELFEERIPRGLAAHQERARELKLLLQFNVTGAEGGSWTVDTLSDPPSCTPGIREDAQCVIEITDEALMGLASAQSASRGGLVMKYIVEGAIYVEGDAPQAMKLGQVFAVSEMPVVSPEGV